MATRGPRDRAADATLAADFYEKCWVFGWEIDDPAPGRVVSQSNAAEYSCFMCILPLWAVNFDVLFGSVGSAGGGVRLVPRLSYGFSR